MDISSPMIRAILFDLDDLMVNSAPLHIEASRRVFAPLGVDIAEIPSHIVATYFGRRVSEIVRLITEYFGLDRSVDIEGLIREREEVFLDLVREGVEPMPGLFELISVLRPLDIKRAVASSGTKVYIKVVLDKLGFSDFFPVVVSGDMVKNGKPGPDIFLKAAELLGVSPSECLVLEDSTMGIEAAKRAGMFCIGVDNSLSPYKQDLSQADLVVNRLDQIDLDLFKES